VLLKRSNYAKEIWLLQIPSSSKMSNVAQPDSISFTATRWSMSLFGATEPHRRQPTRLTTKRRLWQLNLESVGTSAEAPSEPIHCGLAAITIQWHRHCYLLALRVVSSHTTVLVECMRGPQTPHYWLQVSVWRHKKLITPHCSSDALEHRPGGLLSKCFRICVQEVP